MPSDQGVFRSNRRRSEYKHGTEPNHLNLSIRENARRSEESVDAFG